MSETSTDIPTNGAEKSELEPTEHTTVDEVLEDIWMVRDCDLYKEEYDECTSFRGRFHQYFIYGSSLDCNQWKKDFNNCVKWTGNKDVNKAANSLIDSEKARRQARFRAHYRNDVWKKRTSPPEDFNKPLPEWMVKRDEGSILAAKAKEINEGVKEEEKPGMCSIM